MWCLCFLQSNSNICFSNMLLRKLLRHYIFTSKGSKLVVVSCIFVSCVVVLFSGGREMTVSTLQRGTVPFSYFLEQRMTFEFPVYCRQPRGFGFIQFLEPRDAAEAQYQLDHQLISGREITVVFAEENRKKPQEMRTKERVRGRPGFGGRRGSRSSYGRSRSRSPRRFSGSPRGGRRSRSLTPPVRPARSPSPGRHGNGLSRSPSPVRSHRRRTGERSPMPAQRSPRRSRDVERRSRDIEPRSRDLELRSRDVDSRSRDVEPRSRDAEPRINGRDGHIARSRSRTPAGLPATPPRRQRSPSPQARRASPAGHRKHSRDAPRDVVGSPIPEPR
ncbi:hypothetical protein M758_6G118600 [Ceratodon purpureus]|nr:hypothetical protein M758_6G118600 [Ceratodon purpureus]